jgi:hypothetical protein
MWNADLHRWVSVGLGGGHTKLGESNRHFGKQLESHGVGSGSDVWFSDGIRLKCDQNLGLPGLGVNIVNVEDNICCYREVCSRLKVGYPFKLVIVVCYLLDHFAVDRCRSLEVVSP